MVMNQNKTCIKLRLIFVVAILVMASLVEPLRAQNVFFEKSPAFHPKFKQLDTNKITWGYLNVPETWGGNNGKMIKIAIAVVKNTSGIKNADAVVFIQGGPGASGMETIWSWLDHPLRKKNDIVLLDYRGTGYSLPRLCPDLGKSFLEILAKNQSVEEDELQKTNAALSCKQELINKGIDINRYNSQSIAKDLHALRSALNYKKWNVYGVSYGTYIAQVYASNYPEDIKSLILDSSVDDISLYYVNNTSNYMNSLDKVFALSSGTKECNEQYPNLKETYFGVIADLQINPLTVSVNKNILPAGVFTYNAEDFKVAIQQALYNKQLVSVIPLLIYQFKARNKAALGNLVSAFSGLLSMDYGVYYCVSCNEVLPNNDFLRYEQNAGQYKQLQGGISFYKSDFKVCDSWNSKYSDSIKNHYDISNLSTAKFPVLVFGGEFDPITPQGNGKKVAERFIQSYNIEANTYGHVPGFTKIGHEVVVKFIDNPDQKPDINAFKKADKIKLVTGITMNKGISKMGGSLRQLEPLFLFPLALALLLMVIFIFIYLVKFIGNRYTSIADKVVRIGVLSTSVVGLVVMVSLPVAILKISKQNFFILAFGLPGQFGYIFSLVFVFFGLLFLTLLYYFFTRKKTQDRSIVFLAIFSNILLAAYFLYWGIV
jgi:pimeloyl-ACP methyl ester carboxylesterase